MPSIGHLEMKSNYGNKNENHARSRDPKIWVHVGGGSIGKGASLRGESEDRDEKDRDGSECRIFPKSFPGVIMAEIRLQGMGWGKGTPAEEIKPGDRLMWNYGQISTVTDITKSGNQSLIFTERCDGGHVGKRRIRKNTLVARCTV